MAIDAHIGFSRFGLGLRPGDDAAEPRQQMLDEIANPEVAMLAGKRLLDSPAALAAYREFRQARKAGKASMPDDTASDAMAPDAMAETGDLAEPELNRQRKKKRVTGAAGGEIENYNLRTELPVRLARLGEAKPGFAERLVMFWTNHFSIEADNGGTLRALAGPFEREAIRPHILGSFEDLLFAATRHPAMLTYLNNATSVGPDSRAGRRREAGLNENHARELMELHTLGVDGGYNQADVTSLARILTGWSVGRPGSENFGRFMFRAQAHQPGAAALLGQDFDQKGVKQGEAALRLLARHPATARHLATKLARAFVADVPPEALVARLSQSFTDTSGDLHALSQALLEAEESWATPAQKLRSPQEYLWAGYRALNLRPKPGEVTKALQSLGQPLMNPPAPAGFSDLSSTWLAPDAMTTRLDVAQQMALAAGDVDPREIAEAVLGPLLSSTSKQTVERAESPAQGVALLLMSPEFQRR